MMTAVNLHDPWNRKRIHNTHNARSNEKRFGFFRTWSKYDGLNYDELNAGQKLISTREELNVSQIGSGWAGDCSAWPSSDRQAWRVV